MSELKQNIEKQLNTQIQREIQSAYIYMGMMTYFDDQNFPGIANYFLAAAKEELDHAHLIMTYISDSNGRILLEAIDKPQCEFDSAVEAFQLALEHERQVTQWIHEIYKLAKDENDYGTEVFIQKLVTEQVEEVKVASEKLDQVKICDGNAVAMIMLDRELAKESAAEIGNVIGGGEAGA